MGVNRQYSFMYGDTKVMSGSKIEFFGEFFYPDGTRKYGGVNDHCIFRYIENEIYYIEVHGLLCHCKNFPQKIHRFLILNGKKIPNPTTEEDIKAAFILLLVVMGISSIFKGNVVLWILELFIYFKYVKNNKYT